MTEKQIYNTLKREFENSSDSLISDALNWYPETRSYIDSYTIKHNLTLPQACALFSVLSPLKSVSINKRLFEGFLDGKKSGHFTKQINKGKEIISLINPRLSLLDEIVSGNKTVSFYRHLYTPWDNKYAVVDTHMLRISYKGRAPNMTDKKYRIISNCIKKLAKENNYKTSEMQSILWFRAKELYGNDIN